ncbi:sugar ABC transporter ATP-binding protein [Aquiflexum sp.]|uniref:sugar ABC transporter ATP-binding protein n=1 Tax=Aquiflexum sp. TaxID=1872584 RepID=UPI0035930FCF
MLLQLIGITKYFPGVKALEAIDFELKEGEIHALCGENGAGKTTLMNILTGNLQPDHGQILLKGQEISISGPGHAASLGIAIVYQQLSLVDTLSVADNIFANTQPLNSWGMINHQELFRKTRMLLEDLKIKNILPDTQVSGLSPGQKQMVEIAKALSKNPDILILDEPTASITDQETLILFDLMRKLKSEGKAIIYISHRMQEIFRIADRVSVLKDGKYQGTKPIHGITTQQLIQKMVGREILEEVKRGSSVGKEELLRVTGLSGKGFEDISFSLYKGEIVGLGGLVGAGRSEIAQAIFGYLPGTSGTIHLKGIKKSIQHPADAIKAGIGYIPEERKSQGLFMNRSVTDNILVSSPEAAMENNVFKEPLADKIAMEYREKLNIVTPHVLQKVSLLSGGNQQKVVLARWLLADPDILIIDEPTHGIDVGAKAEIYQLLRTLLAKGKGILLISSELPELLALSDRIIVIKAGKISGELRGDEASEESIISLAF